MSSLTPETLFPLPSEETLRAYFVGKDIGDVPTPAAVLDRSIVARHCTTMLETIERLGLRFRAHVKTHKTTQLTRMQVGEKSKQVNLVASTLGEIEHLVPFLLECKNAGREINILYGLPLPASQAARLGHIGKQLGPGSISVMIDDPRQLPFLEDFSKIAGFEACVFLKVDTGHHRAGLPPTAMNKDQMLSSIATCEKAGHARVIGVYSHDGDAYANTTAEGSMSALVNEISSALEAVRHNIGALPKDRRLIVSIGATPQVVSAQNLIQGRSNSETDALQKLLDDPGLNVEIELHAGVYPTLDMQQMATHARYSAKSPVEDVALTIVAEVCSLYVERQKPEALIAAGCLALGRESSRDYRGFGVVSPWRRDKIDVASRLIVDRISQEHGILALESEAPSGMKELPLHVGQKLRIWPNHACITGAMYGWYLIIDSSTGSEGGDKIVDVWVRWRGW